MISLYFVFLSVWKAQAYPNFIGYGYSSCVTCHFNPNGNGPLNDYGRALLSTEISSRLFRTTDDEERIAAGSGFLGATTLPYWWRPAMDYRGAMVSQPLGEGQKNQFIHMQSDFSSVFRMMNNDKYIVVGSLGFIPTSRQAPSTDRQATQNWISREHYVRTDFSKSLRLQAGFMDKAFGLRIPDHEAFSRKYTHNNQNDQTHGVALQFAQPKLEVTIHGFMGNLNQGSDMREKGASLSSDWQVQEKAAIGLSTMWLKSDYAEYSMVSVHPRLGVGKGSSLMFESGIVNMKPLGEESRIGFYQFIQGHLNLAQGLNLLHTAEYYTQDVVKSKTRLMRFGPGVQYFVDQRIELRTEIWMSRSIDPDTVKMEDMTVVTQVHITL